MPTEAERHYVEEVAIFFESSGLPRMSGRVLGWLLICEPPIQSSQQLVEALEASKGSISTSTRQLMQLGLIERAAVPGERGMHFTITPDSWLRLLENRMASLTEFRGIADDGVALLKGAPKARRARIELIRDFYAFLEAEFPKLIERWHEQRRGK
jgi:DNA-binding MarR family transcriptional regulator